MRDALATSPFLPLCGALALLLGACADDIPPGFGQEPQGDNNGDIRVVNNGDNNGAINNASNEGDACRSDSDCFRSLICVEGVCTAPGGGSNNGGDNNGGDNNGAVNNGDNNGDGGCAQAEVCDDNLDNDCNGLVDEGCTCTEIKKDCYSGPMATAGVGECRYGEQVCDSEFYGPCEAEVLPAVELCDGLDNDCDGDADEDWPVGEPCTVGSGACTGQGTWTCASDGQGVICTAQEGQAGVEVCDGADNDCDGQIDEDGVCDNTGPMVTCPPDMQAAPLDTISLRATATDSDNDPLTLRWELISAPVGSTSAPQPTNREDTSLFLDLAGDYTMRFTATDPRGESASCQTRIEAIPSERLRIEMIWNVGVTDDPSDVDLHLWRVGSGGWFDGATDCYFRNCDSSRNQDLEWGAAGSRDNPRLDLDDVEGNGPENINIDFPEDRTYRVGVHYWDDDDFGPSTVIIRIYCLAQLVREFEPVTLRAIGTSPTNDLWQVADVVWSGNTCTVNELGAPGSRDIRPRNSF